MRGKPEVINPADLPEVDLTGGMHACWAVSAERNDADQVNMGFARLEANMSDLVWDQEVDEIFYCVGGQLELLFDDFRGNNGILIAKQGEVLNVPRGYHYILKASGVESIMVFVHKSRPLDFVPEYRARLEGMKAP